MDSAELEKPLIYYTKLLFVIKKKSVCKRGRVLWRGSKLEVITILAVTPLLLRVAYSTSTLKRELIQIQKKTKIHKSCLNFERNKYKRYKYIKRHKYTNPLLLKVASGLVETQRNLW